MDRTFCIREQFTNNIAVNYLDVTRKASILHNFLSTLRNRCTVVDAPNVGRALVFSIKDLASLTKKFAEGMRKFIELEYRSREDRTLHEIKQLRSTILNRE